jgi:cyclohexanecarboxylate-CoA ligase
MPRPRVLEERFGRSWPNRLLNDALDEAVGSHPDRIAVRDPRGGLSYAELREAVDRAALGLLERGLRPGEVVTVQLPNWNEFVVSVLALERIGAVVNPLAPIFREREVSEILRLARPSAVICATSFRGFRYPEMYEGLRRDSPSVRFLVAVGEGDPGTAIPWVELLSGAAASGSRRRDLDALRPDPNSVVELIFTSGTTGEPKGVLHTANTIASGLRSALAVHRLGPDDVFHMASTFGHQTGFLFGIHAPIFLGARAVYQDVWDAAGFLELVETEGITFTMGATPFLADTVRAASVARRDLSSLRTFFCGGAPIPRPLAEEAARCLPCRLVPLWGMTEVGVVTTVRPDDPPEKIVSSDGRPIPGMQVSVRDAEGRPVPAGVEGDLWTRGVAAFVGYVQGRRFTEAFFDLEGWFSTGDRAVLDSDGFVRITGRTKDLIIRGGENVPVKEIEDVLLRHPKIRSVALIGLPHPRLGEIGCACVVPEEGQVVTLEELREFLESEKVTRQFWPERLELLQELPMTPSGKVQKFRLRERFAAPGAADPGPSPSARDEAAARTLRPKRQEEKL